MARVAGLTMAGMVVVLLVTPGFGAILDGDSAAIISGSATFGTSHWSADVEYAVYAPGAYPGTHVDKASNYIYAYQAFNDAGSSVPLSAFSVGLSSGSGASTPTDDGAYGTAGGVATLLSRLMGSPATSAAFAIQPSAGEHTTVLLFSSPNSYTFGSSTVVNGGEGDMQLVPTPVPEPVTISVLALGGIALLRKRRR